MRTLVAFALMASLAPGLVAAQSGAGGQQPRAGACEDCPRKSVVRARARARRADLDQLAAVAAEFNMLQHRLRRDGNEMDAGLRRELEARLAVLNSELTALTKGLGTETAARRLEEMGSGLVVARRALDKAMVNAGRLAAVEAARFTGWIGITLDAPSAVEARGRDVYWRFFEQPRIVSVDPSSPAERAGIRQGDVLLAYDGQDVRREIAMNRLLRPGRTVRVRVRTQRDNEVRDVPVKVAPAPEILWHAWSPDAPAATIKPRSPRAGVEVWPAPTRRPGTDVIVEARPSAAPVMSIASFSGLAGARMETITPGLGEAIGVERGVLVLSVAPGVPAHESGLVDGDVILRANGRDIASVRDLRALMVSSDAKALRLDVSRKGKVRQVTLRW